MKTLTTGLFVITTAALLFISGCSGSSESTGSMSGDASMKSGEMKSGEMTGDSGGMMQEKGMADDKMMKNEM